jgi:hypothetical protein
MRLMITDLTDPISAEQRPVCGMNQFLMFEWVKIGQIERVLLGIGSIGSIWVEGGRLLEVILVKFVDDLRDEFDCLKA